MKVLLSYILKTAKRLKQLYDTNHIAAYSAQAAFFVLMSLVPFALLLVLLFGTTPLFLTDVQKLLSTVFNAAALEDIMQLVSNLEKQPAIPALSLTTLFVLWAATNGVRSIAYGLQNIFDSTGQYNIVQLTLRSVAYTFVMVAVCILSLVVLVFAAPLENAVTQIFGRGATVVLVVLGMRNIIFFFALALLFAIAYKTLAKSGIGFKNQLAGAAVASLGWLVYSFGLSVYIKYFSRYSVLYGSFGAVMLFMLWLYMCMNILLCGALVNRILYRIKCD